MYEIAEELDFLESDEEIADEKGLSLESLAALARGDLTSIRVPKFFKMNICRIIRARIRRLQAQMLDTTKIAGIEIADYGEHEVLSYFIDAVQARSSTAKLFLEIFHPIKKLNSLLTTLNRYFSPRLASSAQYGDCFAGVIKSSLHPQSLLRCDPRQQLPGWQFASQIVSTYKCVLFLSGDDLVGSFAVHQCSMQTAHALGVLPDPRALVGLEVQRLHWRTGDLVIFNAEHPHEFLSHIGEGFMCEWFMGLTAAGKILLWS